MDIYSNLKKCKTLEEAQELYPEFREVLNANDIIKHKSINVKKIEQKIPSKDFSLYILKQKWGELKTLTEIAEELGLKSRSSLGWFMDKIKFPDLTSNYQTLLKASDPKLNEVITQKTKDYNKKHPEKILEHNRMLAQRQELIQMNKELAEIMWEKMPNLKTAMSDFKRLNPDISKKDFSAAFWAAHPEFKEEMSKIRKEIGQKRRLENKENKKNKQ